MPSNYTGNPAATEAPAVAPAISASAAPILVLPVDTDAFNSASTYQPWKVVADYVTFTLQKFSGLVLGTLSAYGIVVDGVGNVASSAAAGAVVAQTVRPTAGGGGTSTPTPTVPLQAIYKNTAPIAMADITNNGAITFNGGHNILSVSRTGLGVVLVTLGVSTTGNPMIVIPSVKVADTSIYCTIGGLNTQLTFTTRSIGSTPALVDRDFWFACWGVGVA